MFVSHKPYGTFALIADYRLKSDHDLDVEEPKKAPHVLEYYSVGKQALGAASYRQTHKIALFEYGAKPSSKERADARAELRAYLSDHQIKVACVLPTAKKDEEGCKQKADTISWETFRAPDSLDEMRGTYFQYNASLIQPIFSQARWLKELQTLQQKDWLQRSAGLCGMGPVKAQKLLACPQKIVSTDQAAVDALVSMYRRPIAIDIENIETTGQITAIGISDGRRSVSIPLDAYTPYNAQYEMPALETYPYGPDILKLVRDLLSKESTAKIFHNHTFDVPRLEQRGLKICGPIHDTIVAHAIAYPELRHGLQHACASLLNIPPWKSVWHPKLPGITRDDIEFWICDPIGLMDYNADDAYFTFKLAEVVMPMVGVNIFEGARRFAA